METIFYGFCRYSLQWKQLLHVVEMYLFNKSFIYGWWNRNFYLVKTMFFYLQLFSLLWIPLLALKSLSTSRNELLCKKIFFHLTDRVVEVSEKWRKRMVSTSREISFPLAKIRSFFENCFLLIPIMVSTRRKIALTKRYAVSFRQKIRLH